MDRNNIKPRVAVIIPTLHGAGCERIVAAMLNDLNINYEFMLILYKKEISYDIPSDLKIHYINSSTSPNHGYIFKIIRFIRRVILIGSILKREKFNILVSFIDTNNIIVFLANWISGSKSKLILSERTIGPQFFKYNSYANKYRVFIIPLLRIVYSKADKVVVLSNAMQEYLKNGLNIKRESIVIPNGIDTSLFKPVTADNHNNNSIEPEYLFPGTRLLTIGRLDDNKDQSFIVSLLPDVLIEIPDAKLFILGVGNFESKIRSLVEKLNLTGKVFIMGWKTNVEDYIKHSDIFLLASHYEGSPNVIIEAMACGIPIVTTRSTDAIDEILDYGEYGTVIPIGDREGFINAIIKTLKLNNSEKHLRNMAAEYARVKYDIGSAKSKYLSIINGLLM